ncbi:MAG TPA: stage II sporulation protein M [Bacillota bacterium]|nr:stage II sporulation protein M [Bacillota bacterium]
MLRHLKDSITSSIKQNLVLYLAIIFTIITGITSGSFTVGAMNEYQKAALDDFLKYSFVEEGPQALNNTRVFLLSTWQHLQLIILIWLSGLFVVGIPFIFVLIGIRSFFIGFTISFLISSYSFGGLVFSLVCILPQTLLFILSYIGIGIIALESSINKFKTRRIKYSREQNIKVLLPYTSNIFILFLGIIVGSSLEAFIMPLFFSMFKWVFN